MYTKQIRYFLTLAEVGSFRRAAELLSISQPALSNSIKSLESQYQIPLFERGPLGVRLTEAGHTLHGFFRNAVDSMERGKREVDLLRSGSHGYLAVGAPTGLIDQLLPDIIENMTAGSRAFNFGVRYGYLTELLAGVRGWQLDVLLTTYWSTANLSADLVIEHFADFAISIYCGANHRLARKRSVSVEDLAAAQWILPESHGIRTFLEEIFGVEHLGSVQRVIVHNYPPFMVRMLEKMEVLTLAPDYTVAAHVRSGALKRLEYPGLEGRLAAGVIYLKGRHMTPALQTFIRVAKELGARRYERATRAR